MFALLGCCLALPVDVAEPPKILRSENEMSPDNGFKFGFDTEDGTRRDEEAKLNNEKELEVSGSYSYYNDKGEEVVVFYTAGVNGFVPHGSIINPKITEVAEAAKDLPKEEPEEFQQYHQ